MIPMQVRSSQKSSSIIEASLKRLNTPYIDLLWIHVWDPIEESMRVAGAATRIDEMGSGES
ncbi:hypothetical protein BH18THE2_BH18THE2_38210 [soil metagenome]